MASPLRTEGRAGARKATQQHLVCIGFMGAAYPEGYVWMNKGEVRQRHARALGWDTL